MLSDQELIERAQNDEIIGGGKKQIPLLCERIKLLERVASAATYYRFGGTEAAQKWLHSRGWEQTTNKFHWFHEELRPYPDWCSDLIALAIELEQALIALDAHRNTTSRG